MGAVWNHRTRLTERWEANESECLNQNGECFYNVHLLKPNLPFMVESVSAVDGSNVPGVIEEVGANGALCSDRHLRHGDHAVRIGPKKTKPNKPQTNKKGILFLAMVFALPNMCLHQPVVSLTK